MFAVGSLLRDTVARLPAEKRRSVSETFDTFLSKLLAKVTAQCPAIVGKLHGSVQEQLYQVWWPVLMEIRDIQIKLG